MPDVENHSEKQIDESHEAGKIEFAHALFSDARNYRREYRNGYEQRPGDFPAVEHRASHEERRNAKDSVNAV